MPGSEQQAYACVISPKSRQNYEICRRVGLWGFTRQAARYAAGIRSGDLLWFYVSGKGFVALAQATGPAEPFGRDETPPWPDERGYAARLPIRFVADLKERIRPSFPPGFGGYKRDPALGIGSNQLLTGFFKLSREQHAALVERSGATSRPTTRSLLLPSGRHLSCFLAGVPHRPRSRLTCRHRILRRGRPTR